MEIYIAKNGQQAGPFSEEQLKSMIQSGMTSLNDQAWHQELSEWTPLHRVLKLCPPVPPVQQPPQIPFKSAPAAQAIAYSGARATFWRRLGASLIDFIIVYVFFALGEAFMSDSNAPGRNVLPLLFVETVAVWLYCALMESSSMQATVGKLACGLVVTDLSGHRINFGKASGRYYAHLVPAIFFGVGFLMALGPGTIADYFDNMVGCLILAAVCYVVGYLMCLWTKRKQSLYDMMAGCLVVTKSATLR